MTVQERVRRLVVAIASSDPLEEFEKRGERCRFCFRAEGIEHAPACAFTEARALLPLLSTPAPIGSDLPARLRARIDHWRMFARELRASPDGGMLAVRDATRLRMCAAEIEQDLELDALQGSETAPPFDAELQLGPIRKRLERAQYHTLPPETIEGDIAFLLRLAADAPAPAPRSRSRGAELIVAERERHLAIEGWTPEHDDGHTDGSLAGAAACLAVEGTDGDFQWVNYGDSWIAGLRDRHASTDRVRQLVIAGSLIASEIDRLLRARGEAELPR